jgi:hypothetical protein
MTFQGDIARFVAKTVIKQKFIFLHVANGMHTSIKEGSKVTGSPGQPVATVGGGQLKNSWQLSFLDLFLASTTTPIIYARGIEEQVDLRTGNQLTLRSEVGGFHSVKLTRAGYQKLVRAAAREVRAL